MRSNPVTAVADAITAGFQLLLAYFKGAPARRARKAIEYAERAIRRWESITPESERDALMKGYVEKFFEYN